MQGKRERRVVEKVEEMEKVEENTKTEPSVVIADTEKQAAS